jgi:rubrerythrin
MSKTEDVLKCLSEGKDTGAIKAETGASEALISRCRKRYEAANQEIDKKLEAEVEALPTDEEIDGVITKIKITPDKKFLTSEEPEEEYHCMGCGHRWKAKAYPASCPGCGAEF